MEGDVTSSQLSLRDEFSSDLLAKNSFEGRSREFSELRVLCSNGSNGARRMEKEFVVESYCILLSEILYCSLI